MQQAQGNEGPRKTYGLREEESERGFVVKALDKENKTGMKS